MANQDSDDIGWDAVLGARLKQIRLEQDRSQSEIAEVAKVSQATISNWERGGPGGPNEDELRAIERFLKRSLEDGASTEEGDLATDLARWLKQAIAARQKSDDLSMNEIAAGAGVSVPTIYNILNGAVAAPQERTLKRLQATSAPFRKRSRRKPQPLVTWEPWASSPNLSHTTTLRGRRSPASIFSMTLPVAQSTSGRARTPWRRGSRTTRPASGSRSR
jgi:transcriptional regulator with XRE-family HTH domain